MVILSEFCKDNGIILVALHANATHILQPMDVAIFHPLKVKWLKAVQQWRFENNDAIYTIRREHFAPLLKDVIDSAITSKILENGFKKCGLCPFTPEAINYKSLIKGIAAEQALDAVQGESNHSIQEVINLAGYLKFFESMVGSQKLEIFRASEPEWSGRLEDKSLFEIWYKFNSIEDIHFEENQPEIFMDEVLNINVAENDNENINSTGSAAAIEAVDASTIILMCRLR